MNGFNFILHLLWFQFIHIQSFISLYEHLIDANETVDSLILIGNGEVMNILSSAIFVKINCQMQN